MQLRVHAFAAATISLILCCNAIGATSMGVSPDAFLTFTSAPRASKSLTISPRSNIAARWSSELPVWSMNLGLAPFFNSSTAPVSSPYLMASRHCSSRLPFRSHLRAFDENCPKPNPLLGTKVLLAFEEEEEEEEEEPLDEAAGLAEATGAGAAFSSLSGGQMHTGRPHLHTATRLDFTSGTDDEEDELGEEDDDEGDEAGAASTDFADLGAVRVEWQLSQTRTFSLKLKCGKGKFLDEHLSQTDLPQLRQ